MHMIETLVRSIESFTHEGYLNDKDHFAEGKEVSYLTGSLGLKFTAGFRHKAYRLLTWIWEVRA